MPEIPIFGKTQPKPEKIKVIQCPICKYIYFETLQMVQIISGLVTKSGKDEMQSVPVLRCGRCGFIINGKEGD